MGSPANGTDEIEWLKRYFIERKKHYDETGEGEEMIPRIDAMYHGILNPKNMLVPLSALNATMIKSIRSPENNRDVPSLSE
mgnify:CR=1 FL=1